MTEAEWLACDEPKPMLEFLRGKATDRKLRLLACGCCRRTWHLLKDTRSQRAIEVAERLADEQAGMEEIRSASVEAHHAWDAQQAGNESVASAAQDVLAIVGLETEHTSIPNQEMVVYCLHHAVFCASHDVGDAAYDERAGWQAANVAWGKASKEEERCQAILLRDIFANPFRPATSNPAWLTSTVVALATGIYQDRAFDRMPILADALMDAGCDNDELLNHCRQPGEHVKGCWVVDLVLGKS